jgi:protein-disulfide isomerase
VLAHLSLPGLSFQASERLLFEREQNADFGAPRLTALRRAFTAALSLAGLAALLGLAPLHPIGNAMAQDATAALVAKPVSLPEIALGSAKAPVTITEYASMSCPHCAAFGENVFPMLRSIYIDTGKVRFVFREFPLDIKAAAASMLARCIANGDAEKYLGIVELLFKQQDQLMARTKDTLKLVGRTAGMSEQAVEACAKDQAQLDKLSADQRFAFEVLKVDSTPTFFINGERLKGAMSFEELDEKIKSLLKR